jgi:hypothetical protein
MNQVKKKKKSIVIFSITLYQIFSFCWSSNFLISCYMQKRAVFVQQNEKKQISFLLAYNYYTVLFLVCVFFCLCILNGEKNILYTNNGKVAKLEHKIKEERREEEREKTEFFINF